MSASVNKSCLVGGWLSGVGSVLKLLTLNKAFCLHLVPVSEFIYSSFSGCALCVTFIPLGI